MKIKKGVAQGPCEVNRKERRQFELDRIFPALIMETVGHGAAPNERRRQGATGGVEKR